jgi:hypothetical protein
MQKRLAIYLKKTLTTKTRLPVLAIILASLLIVSCKKGDPGPAGTTGAAGPAGPAGVAGPVGTANVIYSSWFTPAAYTKDTIFGIYGFNYTKATTDITQIILDSGTVITFGKLNGYTPLIWPANQVEQLPISIEYLSGSTANIDVWSASLSVGNLKIRLVSSTNAYTSISNAHQFRYVIIPGGLKSTVASTKLGLVNGNASPLLLMSYPEICQRLGVPE